MLETELLTWQHHQQIDSQDKRWNEVKRSIQPLFFLTLFPPAFSLPSESSKFEQDKISLPCRLFTMSIELETTKHKAVRVFGREAQAVC